MAGLVDVDLSHVVGIPVCHLRLVPHLGCLIWGVTTRHTGKPKAGGPPSTTPAARSSIGEFGIGDDVIALGCLVIALAAPQSRSPGPSRVTPKRGLLRFRNLLVLAAMTSISSCGSYWQKL